MINKDNKEIRKPDQKTGSDPDLIQSNKVVAPTRPDGPIKPAGSVMITTSDMEKHKRKLDKMYEDEEQRLEDLKNPPPVENLDDMPPPVEMVPESELIGAPEPRQEKKPIKTATKNKAYRRKPRKRKSRAKKKTTINKNETTPDQ